MLTIIPNVVPRRSVDIRALGWLDGRRAESRPNFPANREYLDLRGFTPAELDLVLAEERAAYAELQSENYALAAVERIDRRWLASAVVPMLDFGIGSTVVALSVLGCVPVTSCRGRSLGAGPHQYPAPMATFYARRAQVPRLLEAVEAAGIYIVNSGAKLEVYSDDIRRMHAFAAALQDRIAGG